MGEQRNLSVESLMGDTLVGDYPLLSLFSRPLESGSANGHGSGDRRAGAEGGSPSPLSPAAKVGGWTLEAGALRVPSAPPERSEVASAVDQRVESRPRRR